MLVLSGDGLFFNYVADIIVLMSLEAGRTLGHYEIVEAIGAGGMGEVYRARDTKLRRDVAIKVLPDEFSKDRERVERFERLGSSPS